MSKSTLEKISAPFKMYNDKNDYISEFNIRFNKGQNSFEKLIDFIDYYKDRRINIEFTGDFPMGVISGINKISDNVYVRLTQDNFLAYQELRGNNYKFFFDQDYKVYNYASLECFIDMGVSDVYPTDDLLYNIQETKDYCRSKNVNMRLVLNRIPSTIFNRGNTYKSQLYRPQDMDFLDQYFDMFEFDCGDPYDWAKFDVLYRNWFERKGWNGSLEEINDDLRLHYPILSIPSDITFIKSKCGRRCNKREISFCDKCNQYVEIGKNLEDRQIFIPKNIRRNKKY